MSDTFDIYKFLEDYQRFSCLWLKSDPNFKVWHKRVSAEELLLQGSGLGTIENLWLKIRSIRCTYNQEVTKINNSKSTVSGTANVYIPKLQWFAYAHNFLKKNKDGVKESETNLVSFFKLPRIQEVGPDTGGSPPLADVSIRNPSPGSETRGSVTTTESDASDTDAEDYVSDHMGEVEESGGVAEDPGPITEVILRPDDTTPIHVHLEDIQSILNADVTEEGWLRFVAAMETITDAAASIVKLPVRTPRTTIVPEITDKVDDAKFIQNLYRRNRRQAVRLITTGKGKRCAIPVPEVEDHYRQVWAESQCETELYLTVEGRQEMNLSQFTCDEVSKRLKKFENTAPGNDGLTYRHWGRLDPACSLITAILNVCLRYRRIPPSWKCATTVLIHKKGDEDVINNWRPIALCRTIYKLYAGCIANRLTAWMIQNNVISECQKGFLPADGAFEHIHTLRRALEKARTGKKDKCVSWLDISNAFGEIPHIALEAAISSSGAGNFMVEIVKDIYTDSTSVICTNDGETAEIEIKSGIKQGCPLSGLLFILAMDPVVRKLQGEFINHNVLAFADDLCLLQDDPVSLQSAIDLATELLGKIRLKINVGKCASLHISERRPVGSRDTVFTINNVRMKLLGDGEAASFLEAQVGFNIVPSMSTLKDIIDIGLKITRSKLAPWQRLDAMQTFFFPSTLHLQRMGEFFKSDWEQVDRIIRPELKATMYLPQEASNEYLYGSRKRGACGIRMLAEDSDLAAIDSAFKLLTSPDVRVREDARQHVGETVNRRIGRAADLEETGLYLSGEDDGVFREQRGTGVRNVWSRARMASKRTETKWTVREEDLEINCKDVCALPKQRRNIMRLLQNTLREERSTILTDKPDQGRAMECVAAHEASTHFIKDGAFTRFADWRFVHRARLNLVPLNGSSSWKVGDRRCRRCGYITESLAHVVNHCMRYTSLYMRRHNNLVARIKTAASNKFNILYENQVCGSGRLRPDLVISRNRKIFLIDVTVPFDNRLASFRSAAEEKLTKYGELKEELAIIHGDSAEVLPFIIGSLGSWFPQNDRLMKLICSSKYADLMRKLCVSDTIRLTRDIYIEHLTGITQQDMNT